jgi:hypothetical protein
MKIIREFWNDLTTNERYTDETDDEYAERMADRARAITAWREFLAAWRELQARWRWFISRPGAVLMLLIVIGIILWVIFATIQIAR